MQSTVDTTSYNLFDHNAPLYFKKLFHHLYMSRIHHMKINTSYLFFFRDKFRFAKMTNLLFYLSYVSMSIDWTNKFFIKYISIYFVFTYNLIYRLYAFIKQANTSLPFNLLSPCNNYGIIYLLANKVYIDGSRAVCRIGLNYRTNLSK